MEAEQRALLMFGGGRGDDSGTDAIWMIVAIVVVLIGVGWFYDANRGLINGVLLQIQAGILYPFTLVSERAAGIHHVLTTTPPEKFSWSKVAVAHRLVGEYARWVAAPLFILAGVLIWFSSPVNRYRRYLKIKTLIREAAKENACIRPILDLDLLHEDPDKGPWMYARTPYRWALDRGLILKENGSPVSMSEALDDDGLPLNDVDYEWPSARLDRARARASFSECIGPRLGKIEDLRDYQIGLLAVFAAWVAQMRDEGQELLDQMSSSFDGPPEGGEQIRIDVSGAMDLFRRAYAKDARVKKVIEQHGIYVYVLLCAMLREGRTRAGKLPPAEFIWLRPTNRPLWYALNSLGGDHVCYIEGAGILSHLLMEDAIGEAKSGKRGVASPCSEPQVDLAVDWLEYFLARDRWIGGIEKFHGEKGAPKRQTSRVRRPGAAGPGANARGAAAGGRR